MSACSDRTRSGGHGMARKRLSIKTRDEYLTKAEGWLNKYVGKLPEQRTPKNISDALKDWSQGKPGSTFRSMRAALVYHQERAGFKKSAGRLRKTKRPEHNQNRPNPKRVCRRVNQDELAKLRKDADRRKDDLALAAYTVALFTGARPIEMPTIKCSFHGPSDMKILIKGAKNQLGPDGEVKRGIDREIIMPRDHDLLDAVKDLQGVSYKEVRNLVSRISKSSERLFPKRKLRPSLYTLRHQFASEMKAIGTGRRELASIMGHASQASASQYGHNKLTKGGPLMDRSQIRVVSTSNVKDKPPKDPMSRKPKSEPQVNTKKKLK